MENQCQNMSDYVRVPIRNAVCEAGDGPRPHDRIAAARVAHALVGALYLRHVDDALGKEIVTALNARLDEPQVVRHLLRSLVIGSGSHAELAGDVELAAGEAVARGFGASAMHLVCGMLETEAWRDRIREAWAEFALAHAMAQGEAGGASPERLIRAWLDLHGVVPGWMAAAIQQRPELLVSPHLPTRWVWPLHLAAPTTKGWRLLAGHLNHAHHVLDPGGAGMELDTALETLDMALAEEHFMTQRLVLACWLTEIGGAP
jgi:hypothetical protein